MGQNIVIMATNSLKIQRFRANDLVDNGGKQFELGRSWCEIGRASCRERV